MERLELVFKLKANNIGFLGGNCELIEEALGSVWIHLTAAGLIQVSQSFREEHEAAGEKLRARAKLFNQHEDLCSLDSFFQAEVRDWESARLWLSLDASVEWVQLLRNDYQEDEDVDLFKAGKCFEQIYSAPSCLPLIAKGIGDPHRARQGYLDVVNAPYAWGIPGGGGEHIRLVDVEEGWFLQHEDFEGINFNPMLGDMRENRLAHGTEVLGVIVAQHNSIGVAGIAHRLESVGISSVWRGGVRSHHEAIGAALSYLRFGDILLIEAEKSLQGGPLLPAEVDGRVLKLVQKAVDSGIVVVEAAGNSGVDLGRNGIAETGARFSGAIIVGATNSKPPYRILHDSNSGDRVDCFAWGEGVFTTTSPLRSVLPRTAGAVGGYGTFDDGTSPATAIIAGVIALIQGISKDRLGAPLGPARIREILRDKNNGTQVKKGGRVVGVIPDLVKIDRVLQPKLPEE